MPDPDHRTWQCHLCPEVIAGRAYAALMDHARLMHPDVDRQARWPDDGTLVLTVDPDLMLEEFHA